MRVLHLVRDNGRRGTALFASDLADAMERFDVEAKVAAMELVDDGPSIDADVLGTSSGVTARWGLRGMMKSFDVTVAHGPEAGELCAAAARSSTPFVYRQMRDTRFWARRPPPPKRAPAYFSDARAVVALSSGARGDLIEQLALSATKVHVIPTGVSVGDLHVATESERAESRERVGATDDEFVVMSLGPLVPESGIDVAIRAAIELDGVRLVVAGDGPELSRLERLAHGLAEPGRVVFGGHVPNPMRALAAADAVVHPSVSGESLPSVLIEAGYCGLPAVATPIGSTESIVLDGETGLIVPPGDVAGLRAAIEVLRTGRVGREAMGESARAHCLSRFELAVVAKEWVSVLTQVVGEGH